MRIWARGHLNQEVYFAWAFSSCGLSMDTYSDWTISLAISSDTEIAVAFTNPEHPNPSGWPSSFRPLVVGGMPCYALRDKLAPEV